MPLQRYIAIIFAVVLSLLLIAVCWFNLLNGRAFVNQQISMQSSDTINMVVERLQSPLQESMAAGIEVANELIQTRQIYALSISHQATSAIIFRHRNDVNVTATPSWFVDLGLLKSPLKQKAIPDTPYLVQLQLDVSVGYQLIYRNIRDTLLICAFLISLSWVLGRILVSRLIKPISLIKQSNENISKQQFLKIPKIKTVHELNGLVESHNEMAMQVQTILGELSKRLDDTKQALYRDELTQLGNRRLFSAQFSQMLADQEVQSGALLVVRLSEFETIRSEEGFQVAKSLLEDVIYTLQMGSQQGANAKLYRLNEYEFGCLLLHIDKTQAVQLLNELAADFNQLQQRYQRRKTILMGCVMFRPNESISDILNHADQSIAMAAKELHNFHLFDEHASHINLPLRLKSKEELLRAVAQSQLTFLQQKVMLADGHNHIFVELFTRCTFEGHQIPTPILQAQAEKFACSADLDKRIIAQALKMYLQQKLHLPVSINISPYSVLDDEFTAWLVAESHHYRDFFRSVIWEFDEVALGKIKHSSTLVSQMQALGSKVAIDHFGTGDYTLQSLRNWQVDMIKVDGSYLHNLKENSESYYFLENIIKLAHSMGIIVVCDQVENNTEKQNGIKLGAEGLQGFYIANPENIVL